MQFPYSYFEDEVRDGFYVPGMMKHAWAAQLEILEDIDKVCAKYGITYFADCGTLLGAVRHGGFIPWDDDMDICMKREDYQRFLRVAEDALPENYSILSIYNDEEYDQLFARVVNSRSIRLDQPFLDKYHGFPYACGVDIFPMDFLPSDEEEEFIQQSLLQFILKIAKILENKNISEDEIEKQLCKIEELCNVKIDRARSPRNELYLLADKLCMLYDEQEAEKVTLIPVWVDHREYKTSKEYYRETVKLPFENTTIPAPAAYDAILRYRYGNYMKSVHNWDYHEYPFYENQEQTLREKGGDLLPEYTISVDDLHRAEDGKGKERKKRVRREVVFLPYKASMWDSLESVWRAAEADPDCDAYVIPIPYYEKNMDGSLGKMHYEGGGYPDDVPLVRYDAFDFEEHQPDMIFIQNPYDEYNCSISVDPFFYSVNLKNYTDKLIYIPYFMTDEIDPGNQRAIANMKYYVTVPGVIHADRVIVQSENMRRLYIERLMEFAGEETRKVWEEKIMGLGSPKVDCSRGISEEKRELPEEWRPYVQKEDGSYKKIVLYYIGFSSFAQYGERVIAKMKETFDIFAENCENVVMLWNPLSLDKTMLEREDPKLYREYCLLERQYCEYALGIPCVDMPDEMLAAVCDAYYGDASPLAQMCRNQGKAVMMQKVQA